jgi:GNAT superfamily N-acetyltransferase
VTTTEKQMIEDKELFSCLVAIKEGAIVGFASYFFAYYSWTGKALYLDDLYVKENFRGQGIGNKLFDEVINIARETKCSGRFQNGTRLPSVFTKARVQSLMMWRSIAT